MVSTSFKHVSTCLFKPTGVSVYKHVYVYKLNNRCFCSAGINRILFANCHWHIKNKTMKTYGCSVLLQKTVEEAPIHSWLCFFWDRVREKVSQRKSDFPFTFPGARMCWGLLPAAPEGEQPSRRTPPRFPRQNPLWDAGSIAGLHDTKKSLAAGLPWRCLCPLLVPGHG